MKIKTLGMIILTSFVLSACSQKNQEKSLSSSSEIIKKSSEKETMNVTVSSLVETSEKEASQPSSSMKETSQEATSQLTSLKRCLEVPMQVQRKWYTCAPTTVSMILESQGIQVSQEQLAEEMETDDSFGTHNKNAVQILNKHLFGYEIPKEGQAGYRLAKVSSSDSSSDDMRLFKERLKKNIDDGYPMYYTMEIAKVYPGHKGEHNVIGTGYELTADGKDIAAIYYVDPLESVQDPIYGGLQKITPEELLEAMVVCEEPNYAW
ncbi:C39 family peptidase [Streptococcus pneumoniae]